MAQMNYTLSVLLKSKLDADFLITQATYDKAPIIPEKGDILLLSGPNLKEIKSYNGVTSFVASGFLFAVTRI